MTDVNAARVEELIFENWLVKKKKVNVKVALEEAIESPEGE